jgi:hypothetical protein
VCVAWDAFFRIVTGTIYGSNEAEGLKNTASSGAALSNDSDEGVTTYGPNGTETTLNDTDDTIRVVNGDLQL